ncbi:MAG TPA: Hsp20/alpha crystallin family protein [Bacteroidia bacterium]|jgi:HSP20 family protein|nr:Hsp20/alpha crystallin family protein [Bacteroidia bacterium]
MTLITLNKQPKSTDRFMPVFDEALNDFLSGSYTARNFFTKHAAVNIKEDEKNYHLEFAVPGFEKEEFKINFENQLLTISAEKKNEAKEENKNYTRREFAYNSFQRSFTLPESVQENSIKAEYKNGILTVNIPKKEETNKQKREISVE